MTMFHTKNKIINKHYYHQPVLIYLKEGKVLQAFGMDNEKLYTTHFFQVEEVKEDSDCIELRQLILKKYCGLYFLKPTIDTFHVLKDHILGLQCIEDIEITSGLIVHYPITEKLEGNYQLPEGYLESVIWQSNLRIPYQGHATITYTNGEEEIIDILVEDLNQKVRAYKLQKHKPLIFGFKKGSKITISKKDLDSKLSGKFFIYIDGEYKEKLRF